MSPTHPVYVELEARRFAVRTRIRQLAALMPWDQVPEIAWPALGRAKEAQELKARQKEIARLSVEYQRMREESELIKERLADPVKNLAYVELEARRFAVRTEIRHLAALMPRDQIPEIAWPALGRSK